MKHLEHFKKFQRLNEAFNFELPDVIKNLLIGYEDKKKESVDRILHLLLKDILNIFSKTVEVSKGYPSSNTEGKIRELAYVYNRDMTREYAHKMISIRDYLERNPLGNTTTFDELYQRSEDWHNNLTAVKTGDTKIHRKDEDNLYVNKFIVYPNGWYWINLNTDSSEEEGKYMGHCGADFGNTIISLRDENSYSHITASYNEVKKTLHQCKGSHNTKPKEKYHPYIISLLLNKIYPIKSVMPGSYKPHLDFSLNDLKESELKELFEQNPSLEYTQNMFLSYIEKNNFHKCVEMLLNDFVFNGFLLHEEKLVDLFKYVLSLKMKEIDIHRIISNTRCIDTAINVNPETGLELYKINSEVFFPYFKQYLLSGAVHGTAYIQVNIEKTDTELLKRVLKEIGENIDENVILRMIEQIEKGLGLGITRGESSLNLLRFCLLKKFGLEKPFVKKVIERTTKFLDFFMGKKLTELQIDDLRKIENYLYNIHNVMVFFDRKKVISFLSYLYSDIAHRETITGDNKKLFDFYSKNIIPIVIKCAEKAHLRLAVYGE